MKRLFIIGALFMIPALAPLSARAEDAALLAPILAQRNRIHPSPGRAG